MRIGFDVDGVLANWNERFIERVKNETGRDLFGEGFVPRTWSYAEAAGYSQQEIDHVWRRIVADRTFWHGLNPYPDAMSVLEHLRSLSLDHDVYFITSRPGIKAKHQTESWLATYSGDFLWNPTVLISSEKGDCAKALKLDAYIDDRWENCENVVDRTMPYDFEEGGGVTVLGPTTRVYLLDQPWNQGHTDLHIFRIASPHVMLNIIETNLATMQAAA